MGDKFGLTFRPGGPREARLKKNGLLMTQVADFYSIRVARLPKGITYVYLFVL